MPENTCPYCHPKIYGPPPRRQDEAALGRSVAHAMGQHRDNPDSLCTACRGIALVKRMAKEHGDA